MRIEYEQKRDILNIGFLKDVPVVDSVEWEEIIVDYSACKALRFLRSIHQKKCRRMVSPWLLWPMLI